MRRDGRAAVAERGLPLGPGREEILQAAIDSAEDAIVIAGLDGRIREFSGGAERLFGWKAAEVLGRPLSMLVPAAHRAAKRRKLEAMARSDSPKPPAGHREIEGLRRDGSTVPLDCRLSELRTAGGLFVTAILRDATERHRFEEAVRRSERTFRTLAERVPVAILVQRDGKVVYANPVARDLLGRPDPCGVPISELLPPGDRPALLDLVESVERTGEPVPLAPSRILRPDGGVVLVEAAAFPLDFEGRPSTALMARDTSEQQELATRMMAMDRLITMGTLAAGVGHEINNPLTWILANLDFAMSEVSRLASAGAIPPDGFRELTRTLEEARDGTTRVAGIVRDLKRLSRAEETRARPVDLARVLDTAIRMSSNEVQHRATITREIPALPLVLGHRGRLEQVFLNLLLNAAQAIPAGDADAHEITIRARRVGDRVAVEVADTGQGIRPEHLDRVFEPFFTTKPPGAGTGLGLAICRQIVRASGGEIEVESEPGRGSVFRTSLPVAAGDPAESDRPPPRAPATSAARPRVLVIDDQRTIGMAIARLLRRTCEVVHHADPRLAVARIDTGERYDLILCDLMMPEMTGIEVHAALERSVPEEARRMVFMTGGAFDPAARAFLRRVENPCIDKPFDIATFPGRILELVEKLGSGAAADGGMDGT